MVAKMSMVLWGLWTQRNNILWHHDNLSPSRVVSDCLCFRHDWLSTISGLQGVVNTIYRPTAGLMWCCPTAGFYKYNCDAAIFEASSITGQGCMFGLIIQDCQIFFPLGMIVLSLFYLETS